jgi:hypothetical protein
MSYSYFPFQVPAGQDIEQNIGFNPTAVVVSNYSPFYIYFPDGLNFCPPMTSGAVIPLAHATQARATWTQSPFGSQTVYAAPANLQYTASLSFTDDPTLAPNGGTSINLPATPIAISGRLLLPAETLVLQNPLNKFFYTTLVVSGVLIGGTVGELVFDIQDTNGNELDLAQITFGPNITITVSLVNLQWNVLSMNSTWALYLTAFDGLGTSSFYLSYMLY